MTIPDWFGVVLLSLAAFRTWRLIAEDDITERLRRYVTGLPQDWKTGDHLPLSYKEGLAEFIECPWCLGFWVGLGWWAAYEKWPHGTLVVSVPLAISALAALVARVASQP